MMRTGLRGQDRKDRERTAFGKGMERAGGRGGDKCRWRVAIRFGARRYCITTSFLRTELKVTRRKLLSHDDGHWKTDCQLTDINICVYTCVCVKHLCIKGRDRVMYIKVGCRTFSIKLHFYIIVKRLNTDRNTCLNILVQSKGDPNGSL